MRHLITIQILLDNVVQNDSILSAFPLLRHLPFPPMYSYFDITSSNFDSEKVHGDYIFGRQDLLYFFSGKFKDYKIQLCSY